MRAPRVRVHGHRAHRHLHRQHPAHAQRIDGPPAGVNIALLPDRPLAGQQVLVVSHKLGDVRAADLLFPFHNKRDPARQRVSVHRAHRVDCGQPRHEFALVINRPACIQRPIAHRRLEGRHRPQLQRLRRLHIIVVIEEQRARRCAAAVRHNHRVAACGDLVDRELAPLEHRLDQVGAFKHALARSRHTGLRAQLGRLGHIGFEAFQQIEVQFCIGGVHGLGSLEPGDARRPPRPWRKNGAGAPELLTLYHAWEQRGGAAGADVRACSSPVAPLSAARSSTAR